MINYFRVGIALIILCCTYLNSYSQVDTSYLFNPAAPYGVLDIRIARSSNEYYYLEDNKTFSFRQVEGSQTNTYLDMTAWDSSPYHEGNMRISASGSNAFVMNYRYLKPKNYDNDYSSGYPLVLVLHGLQERGNCAGAKCYHSAPSYSPNANVPAASIKFDNPLLNNDYNLVHGGANYLEAYNINGSALPNDPDLPARAFPGFVVFPQNLNGWHATSVEDAIRIVRLMIKKYNIDVNRIYINGVSNGGHGTYEAMKRAPWLFAAGVFFSAADDASVTDQNLGSDIAGIPMWVFQGGIDKKPTPKQTENYIKQFRDAGANIKYTLYDNLGHGTWNKAFSEPEFFSWMLRQRKNNIHVFANNPIVCKTTGKGTDLSLPKGYPSYEWEFNGKILSGENKFRIIAKLPGAYRGRVITSASTEWSATVNVNESYPLPVQIVQVGTTLLKDPNASNEAVLKANESSAHYYWFKNGSAIDFPGEEDDTIRTPRFKSNYGDGVYTLQVAGYDNCLSPSSQPKHIFFNDRATINIETPKNLDVSGSSASEVLVTWQDASNNEEGFEIWRRKVDDGLPSKWLMTSLTGNQVNSFTDKNLIPSSTYEYMIRAVSSQGRSLYTEKQVIKTFPDNIPPSSPSELTVKIESVKTLKLNWKASEDNSSIKEYLIYTSDDTIHTGSTDTTFIIEKFQVNHQYSFSIRSIDAGGNISEPSNTAIIDTKISGLFYQHSTGEWNSLNEIDWRVAEFTGMVDHFTLSPKTQEDFFNFRFDGYLNIEKDGVYQFRISSNDGSRLSLDDSLLILNDGIHNLATVTAPIQLLSTGPHRITVDFFDNVLSDSLLVEYKGPDSNNDWISIPSARLSSDIVTSVEGPSIISDFDFTVYPNPSNGENLNISFSGVAARSISISILSNTGQKVFQTNKQAGEANDQILLSELQSLSGGLYIIEAVQEGVRKSKRLLIIE